MLFRLSPNESLAAIKVKDGLLDLYEPWRHFQAVKIRRSTESSNAWSNLASVLLNLHEFITRD